MAVTFGRTYREHYASLIASGFGTEAQCKVEAKARALIDRIGARNHAKSMERLYASR